MLGEKIYNLRKQKGFSQEELGNKINVSRQTISNWELNETTPNIEQLKLLSKVFNVSIDDLLDNDVKSVLIERVSNTEKLAGIIIKILKIMGIVLIAFVLIDVIASVFFTTSKKIESSAQVVCTLEEEKYEIEISSKKYFNCDNCSLDMKHELEKLVDFNHIDKSINIIEDYFISNNGYCE